MPYTQECPTLWRVYDYFTSSEKKSTLETRESKSTLKLGEGGEGFIATDEWCYNCGNSGHWGDVRTFFLFIVNSSVLNAGL